MITSIKLLYTVATAATIVALSFIDGINHGYHKGEPAWSCKICKHSSAARKINLDREAARSAS
jgi:hypothetical protein